MNWGFAADMAPMSVGLIAQSGKHGTSDEKNILFPINALRFPYYQEWDVEAENMSKMGMFCRPT